MNTQNTSIGPLMKAARKFRKFNQSDVAQAIGCSQSALSKMEHNLLIPNAPQWFLFARFTAIPPETIETGIIDRHSKVTLNNDNVSLGFKLPKRYRLNRAQKVREIYPFLYYLEKEINHEAFNQFTQSVSIDSEFFLDFDNLINFQMIVDLINLYIRLDKKSPEDIKSMVMFGQDTIYWDKFDDEWKQLNAYKEVLSLFISEQNSFQGDFDLKLKEMDAALMISYIPEPHLYHFLKDVTDETKAWLTLYRKYTLEALVHRTMGIQIEASPLPALANSPLEDHFRIA